VKTVARSLPDYRKSLRRLSVMRKRRCSICAGYLSTALPFHRTRENGDGCVGLHLMQVSRRRAQGCDGCTEASAVRIVAVSLPLMNSACDRAAETRIAAAAPPDYRKSLRRLSVVRKRRCSLWAPDICRPSYRFTCSGEMLTPPHGQAPTVSQVKRGGGRKICRSRFGSLRLL
jgi:hypothetical protein